MVNKYMGDYCKKICQQEFSRIAQYGHTGIVSSSVHSDALLCRTLAFFNCHKRSSLLCKTNQFERGLKLDTGAVKVNFRVKKLPQNS